MSMWTKLFKGNEARTADPPPERKPALLSAETREMSAPVKIHRPTCTECGRRLLNAGASCPFCTPQFYGCELENTQAVDCAPKGRLGGMNGVVVAHMAAREHGARGFLHVYEGPNKGMTVLVGDLPLTIGRNPLHATLVLGDTGISGRHCEVRPTPEGLRLIDLGSRNGSFVNDDRVDQRDLDDSDVIALAGTRIYIGICSATPSL